MFKRIFNISCLIFITSFFTACTSMTAGVNKVFNERNTVFDAAAPNSNQYYPNVAITLANIAYDSKNNIRTSVQQQTGLDVVWGPYEAEGRFDIPYSLMYVARNRVTKEYFVVIRGTQWDSLYSWLKEDFKVSVTKPFNKLSGNPAVPSSVTISEGTYDGMNNLLSLGSENSNTLVNFLKQVQPRSLYITGHSLGGTLTPAMYVYLNAKLYSGKKVNNMALWSFAGLTPGGDGFNNYFEQISPTGLKWRFHNNLDIAPYFWYSEDSVKNVYSKERLYWSYAEELLIYELFKGANSSGANYAQPKMGSTPLQGKFDTDWLPDYSWAAQALHQHHSSTYLKLVRQQYSIQ